MITDINTIFDCPLLFSQESPVRIDDVDMQFQLVLNYFPTHQVHILDMTVSKYIIGDPFE